MRNHSYCVHWKNLKGIEIGEGERDLRKKRNRCCWGSEEEDDFVCFHFSVLLPC